MSDTDTVATLPPRKITLCQSCIERQLEPNEAIGLYQGVPICDKCYGEIRNNLSVSQDNENGTAETANEGMKSALAILDQIEDLIEQWPLKADEVLIERDQFFNHRAPAIVNIPLDQLNLILSRRKGLLYAIRIKDEHWTQVIEQARTEARKEAGLKGVGKSVKETVKKVSGTSEEKEKKLAKMLGITVTQLRAMGADARKEDFTNIVGKEEVKEAVKKDGSTATILHNLQEKIKGNQDTTVVAAVASKRCSICKKLTCICPRR